MSNSPASTTTLSSISAICLLGNFGSTKDWNNGHSDAVEWGLKSFEIRAGLPAGAL